MTKIAGKSTDLQVEVPVSREYADSSMSMACGHADAVLNVVSFPIFCFVSVVYVRRLKLKTLSDKNVL